MVMLHSLLPNKIYLPTKLQVMSLIVLDVRPGPNSKCKNEQMAMTPELGFVALHVYLIRSIYLQMFLLITLLLPKLCPGQKIKGFYFMFRTIFFFKKGDN